MQQRLDLLSADASEVVRVAAVLPDRFSAGLLAAMLDRSPASLLSALEEAVRADLLVEDGEQFGFGMTCCVRPHDGVAAVAAAGDGAPVGVRDARDGRGPGRGGHPVGAQRRAGRPGGDRRAAPSRPIGWPRRCERGRGLEPACVGAVARDDAEYGSLVAETVEWLTGPAATARPKTWPLRRSGRRCRPKSRPKSPPAPGAHQAQHPVAGGGESPGARVERHQRGHPGSASGVAGLQPGVAGQKWATATAADEAAAAAAATGDLEAKIMTEVTLALLDVGEGHRGRALGRLEQLCSIGYTNNAASRMAMPQCTSQSCSQ